MKNKLISLDECLFAAFADSKYCNAQDKGHIWAIWEGLWRAYPNVPRFRQVNARKDHKCARGCSIVRGEIYFREAGAGEWDGFARLCVPCVAMILYYRGVSEMPVSFATHWDPSEQASVRELNATGLQRLLERIKLDSPNVPTPRARGDHGVTREKG